MNNWTISGRLGRDAETRQAGEHAVTGFSVAVDERKGREKVTTWVDVSLWGARGEALQPHLTKGTVVSVCGRAGVRTFEKNGETKAVLTLNATDLSLLGGGERSDERSSDNRPSGAQSTQRQPTPQPSRGGDFADDDIPF